LVVLLVFFLIVDGFSLSAPMDSAPAATTWQRAIGAWPWLFPRDHGAHPNFQTEWWYFTGNLRDAQQHRYGYQLTLFRQGIQFQPSQTQSRWAARDFYFGHFTISDVAQDQFHVQERVSRGALGEAGSAVGRMDVALGPWTIKQGQNEEIILTASEPEMAIHLAEHPLKPLILEGRGGLSQKDEGAGEASYYYSYPRLATTGQVRIGEKSCQVSGLSWFDHEFSTNSLGADQVGWDWFCIQLNDQEEIMLYVMRDKSGAMDPVSEGTWVHANGSAERLVPGSFSVARLGNWRSPVSGAVYPAGWHIQVPGHEAELTVSPAMPNQELHLTKMGVLDYWEGACSTAGTVAGRSVSGEGYTELTGYAGSLQAGMKD